MTKRTLVFGASLKADRYSNMLVRKLLDKNHEVFAYGFEEGAIENVKIDTAMKPYKEIHTVTLYLSPRRQKAYYKYLIDLNPERIIFNPGTENPEFYKQLRESQIEFEESCSLVLLSINEY